MIFDIIIGSMLSVVLLILKMIGYFAPSISKLFMKLIQKFLFFYGPLFLLHASSCAFWDAHLKLVGWNKWEYTILPWGFFIGFFLGEVEVERILFFWLGFQERNRHWHYFFRYFNIINQILPLMFLIHRYPLIFISYLMGQS